jgi:hypothetical protein
LASHCIKTGLAVSRHMMPAKAYDEGIASGVTVLDRIKSDRTRVGLVEDAIRFACLLMAQKLGVMVMQQRDV